MSMYVESFKELERIHESEEYEKFAEVVTNISNLGVATAILGGFLQTWCEVHEEDFLHAVTLMLLAYKEVKK